MELVQKVTFSGSFSQAGGEDTRPAAIENGTVEFYNTGQVHLILDEGLANDLNAKRMVEEHDSQHPYEGGYKIAGTTKDGRQLAATVMADTTFAPKFSLLQITLTNPDSSKKPIVAVEYGLSSNKAIRSQPITLFPNAHVQFSIEATKWEKDATNIQLRLGAKFKIQTLPNINTQPDETAEPDFGYCCGIIQLLLLFASGKEVTSIYEKEYRGELKDATKEYWQGNIRAQPGTSDVSIIEVGLQSQFISTVFQTLSLETVESCRLFPALYWYAESFRSQVTYTKLVLLFVCLESIVSRKKPKVSRKLVPTAFFNEVKESIESLLEEKRKQISSEDEEKFEIFSNKVMSGFRNGEANKGPALSIKTEALLKNLDIEYKDLFPSMKTLVDLRNDLVHGGESSGMSHDDAFKIRMKVTNLLSRIILTILGYEGIYLERNDQGEIRGKTLAKKKE